MRARTGGPPRTTERLLSTRRRLSPTDLASRLGRAPFPLSSPSWPQTVSRPAPTPELGVDYDGAWSRRYPVRLARAFLIDNVARPAARVIASPLVRGEEWLRDLEGPVIFVANHASHVDTPLLLTCLPLRFRHRTVVAAASDYFFDRRWKAATWSFLLGIIPVERAKVNRRSVQLAADLVSEGWNLVIFPEGGRSPDGWGQTFTAGAAFLAVRTGCPVVPVHLDGTRHILPKDGRALRRARTTITFGAPLSPTDGEDARRFGARIEASVAIMADETSSDWWTARKRAAAGTTPPLQGPDAAAWRRSWMLDPAPDAGSSGWPRWWSTDGRFPRESDDGDRVSWPRRSGGGRRR